MEADFTLLSNLCINLTTYETEMSRTFRCAVSFSMVCMILWKPCRKLVWYNSISKMWLSCKETRCFPACDDSVKVTSCPCTWKAVSGITGTRITQFICQHSCCLHVLPLDVTDRLGIPLTISDEWIGVRLNNGQICSPSCIISKQFFGMLAMHELVGNSCYLGLIYNLMSSTLEQEKWGQLSILTDWLMLIHFLHFFFF